MNSLLALLACVAAAQAAYVAPSGTGCSEVVVCDLYNLDSNGFAILCNNGVTPCTVAACCRSGYVPPPPPPPAPSIVRCDTKVKCAVYNSDPKVGGIRRCKPRTGTTMPCTEAYCCKSGSYVPPPPPKPDPITVRCDKSGVSCKAYKTSGYNGVLSCVKNLPGASNACTSSYCCAPAYVPPPPPPSPSLVPCNSVVTTCGVYNKDPKTGGVLRCKNRTGTSMPCTTAFCCAGYVPAPDTTKYPCTAKVSCAVYRTDALDNLLTCSTAFGAPNPCVSGYCCAGESLY